MKKNLLLPIVLLPLLCICFCGRTLNTSTISVSILGEEINLEDGEFSFGLVPSGVEQQPIDVTVTNTGGTDLTIQNLLLTSDSRAEDDFVLSDTSLPTIAPGSSQSFGVSFEPASSGERTASLSISSNATDRPTASLTVRGSTEWGTAFVDNGTLNKNSASHAEHPSFTSLSGTLYAAWEEALSARQIRVAVYNGSPTSPSWSLVDGNATTGLNKNSARDGSHPQLISHGGKIYLTWDERGTSGAGTQIRVAVFNGDTSSPSWSFVDGNGATGLNKDTLEDASNPRLVSFSDKLYLFWNEEADAGTQIRAAVYNGNDSSPSWSFVDGNGATGLNKVTTQDGLKPTAYVFNSKLYASWYEEAATFNNIRVAVYNGNDSSPSWTFVDGNLARDASNEASRPQLIEFEDALYLAWNERVNEKIRVRAAVYGGDDSSPSWTELDGGTGIFKTSTENASRAQFLSFRKKLYLIWNESRDAVSDIRVALYNGNSDSPAWYFVDGNGSVGINKSSSGTAMDPKILSLGGRMYAIWSESTNGIGQIRVGVANY